MLRVLMAVVLFTSTCSTVEPAVAQESGSRVDMPRWTLVYQRFDGIEFADGEVRYLGKPGIFTLSTVLEELTPEQFAAVQEARIGGSTKLRYFSLWQNTKELKRFKIVWQRFRSKKYWEFWAGDEPKATENSEVQSPPSSPAVFWKVRYYKGADLKWQARPRLRVKHGKTISFRFSRALAEMDDEFKDAVEATLFLAHNVTPQTKLRFIEVTQNQDDPRRFEVNYALWSRSKRASEPKTVGITFGDPIKLLQ